MAFALKGAGSATTAWSITANQASLVVTTATTAGAAGDLAVLLYAVDNNATVDGDEGAVTGVTDSAGNFWEKGAEFTNGQGTAQTGATCGIWFCNLQNALAIGATVTLAFSNAASRDAAAASLTYFTKAAGFRASVEGTPGTLANDAAAAGSLDSTTANIACLRIRAIASESSTATALTKTAAFTAVLTQAISTGGATATNQGIRGEYLISTATGQASAPTGGAGAVDNASVYVAFKEVAIIVGDPSHNLDYQGGQVAITTGKAIAATLIAASAGLFLPPTPRVADPVPTGWHQQLSVAPKVVRAVHTQPQLTVAPASAGAVGIPLQLGGAPPRTRNVYYQARVEAPYVPSAATITVPLPIDMGGQLPQLRPLYVQNRVDPPYVTPAAVVQAPQGWFSALSGAPRAAQAQAGFSVVPFVTSNPVTIDEWQQPFSGAPPMAKAQAGHASVPYNTAQLSVNFTPLGWQGPIAGAPPAAKPQAGLVALPYTQSAVATVDQWLQPYSAAPPVRRVADVPYQLPIYTAVAADNTVTIDKWQQPLSTASPVNKAQPGSGFVPFNTVQPVAGVYTAWYLQPLSIAAPVNKPQPGYSFVPLDTRQVATTLDWQQPLSGAPRVALAQPGFSFVPFDTAQLSVNFTNFGWQGPTAAAVKPVMASSDQPIFINVSASVPLGWYQALSIAPLAAKVTFANQPLVSAPATVSTLSWQQPLSVLTPHAIAQLGSVTQPSYVAPVVLAGIAGMAWFTPLAVPLRMQNKARQSELISITRFDTVAPVGTLPHSKPFFVTPGKLMNI